MAATQATTLRSANSEPPIGELPIQVELIVERRPKPARASPAFWNAPKRSSAQPKAAWQALIGRVRAGSPGALYAAVDAGVPTSVVAVIGGALGFTSAAAMELVGVSETTLRRKEEAGEPLPEVAGHRVMALLRLAATLQRLLDESGEPAEVAAFDLEAWLRDWLRAPLAEFDGKTPAALLRNPEGQRALEELLLRMRGGLPA